MGKSCWVARHHCYVCSTHHGFLVIVGLDTTYEERMARGQSSHQQVQRFLELSAQCGGTFSCLLPLVMTKGLLRL